MGGSVRSAAGLLGLLALLACGPADTRPAPEAWSPSARLLAREAGARASAPEAGRDAVVSSLTRDGVTHRGLRLGPTEAVEWEVDVPPAVVLAFGATLTSPSGPQLAGLSIEVSEEAGPGSTLAREQTGPDWTSHRIDLSPWSGRRIRLRLRAVGDAALPPPELFVREPMLYEPQAAPRRVLLVFVDTLRADHLGLYGYERDTSPNLDRFAREAAVFEVARAPAPWTLPSAQAALSGRQPEDWGEGPNLPERVAEAGIVPLAVASNSFLGPAFGMERGWSRHWLRQKSGAGTVVEEALALLEEHDDRDVLLMVHLMDPHLPYREPSPFRELWVSDPPPTREEITRADLLALDPRAPDFEAWRRFVIDRYDQTIRYLDHELARLLDAVGPDATVVVFSDHGEEFWDHGGAEHGHTLFEELLRVPLLIRDRHVPPGRHRAPASLLDVTPTVLALLGLEPEGLHGRSLLPALRGGALAARPEAFGRPLYGGDGWGVWKDGRKWTNRGGRQWLVDLEHDPDESADLAAAEGADLSAYPDALRRALAQEVRLVWRVLLHSPPGDEPVSFRLDHPHGFERSWVPYDPLEKATGVALRIEGRSVVIDQAAGSAAPRAVYVLPAGDARDTGGLTLRISGGGRGAQAEAAGGRREFGGGALPPLLRAGDAERGALVLFAYVPLPSGQESTPIPEDVREALAELGYLE
jgi:arylsulfatase A-like enzyme